MAEDNSSNNLFSKFLGMFKNKDGSLNFEGIGDLLGAGGNLFQGYGALKQFGLAEDNFNLNRTLALDNHANNIALAQRDIQMQDLVRAIENNYTAGSLQQQAQQLGLPGPSLGLTLQNSFGSNATNNVANNTGTLPGTGVTGKRGNMMGDMIQGNAALPNPQNAPSLNQIINDFYTPSPYDRSHKGGI